MSRHSCLRFRIFSKNTSSEPIEEHFRKVWGFSFGKQCLLITGQGGPVGFRIVLGKNNFLKTPRGTFLTNLATSHAVVLETLKLFQPIRGMGSHLEYLMASKRYTSSEHLEQLWQAWWMDMQWF